MWTNHRRVKFFVIVFPLGSVTQTVLLTPQFSIEEMQNGKVKKKKIVASLFNYFNSLTFTFFADELTYN